MKLVAIALHSITLDCVGRWAPCHSAVYSLYVPQAFWCSSLSIHQGSLIVGPHSPTIKHIMTQIPHS